MDLACGNAVANLRLYDELDRILKLFAAAAIPAMPLKGAHLAKAVYENVSWRRIGDIDLLVRTDDLAAAGELLQRDGYQPRVPYVVDVVRAVEKHLPRFDKPDCRNVELHWNLASSEEGCDVRPPELWDRARHARLGDVDALVLSDEDLLLHQCLHTA